MKITIEVECPKWMRAAANVALPVVGMCAAGIAFAAPEPFKPNTPISASAMNARFGAVENDVAALKHPASGFRAYVLAPLTVQDEATTADVVFDQVIFDDGDGGGEYDKATGVFSPHHAGTYLIECGFAFFASGDAVFAANIYRNNAEIDAASAWSAGALQDSTVTPRVSQIQKLAAGDAVTCRAYLDSEPDSAKPLLIFDARNSFSAIRID